jgi:hypothetical protein
VALHNAAQLLAAARVWAFHCNTRLRWGLAECPLLHLHPRSYNSIIPEPNNLDYSPELCAGGNFTQAFGERNASGWADANCSIAAPFVCKMMKDLVRWGGWSCGVMQYYVDNAMHVMHDMQQPAIKLHGPALHQHRLLASF